MSLTWNSSSMPIIHRLISLYIKFSAYSVQGFFLNLSFSLIEWSSPDILSSTWFVHVNKTLNWGFYYTEFFISFFIISLGFLQYFSLLNLTFVSWTVLIIPFICLLVSLWTSVILFFSSLSSFRCLCSLWMPTLVGHVYDCSLSSVLNFVWVALLGKHYYRIGGSRRKGKSSWFIVLFVV